MLVLLATMLLLFPVSWHEYQLGLIHSDSYSVALIFLVLAAFMFVLQKNLKIVKGSQAGDA
jgi:hypothetical protein